MSVEEMKQWRQVSTVAKRLVGILGVHPQNSGRLLVLDYGIEGKVFTKPIQTVFIVLVSMPLIVVPLLFSNNPFRRRTYIWSALTLLPLATVLSVTMAGLTPAINGVGSEEFTYSAFARLWPETTGVVPAYYQLVRGAVLAACGVFVSLSFLGIMWTRSGESFYSFQHQRNIDHARAMLRNRRVRLGEGRTRGKTYFATLAALRPLFINSPRQRLVEAVLGVIRGTEEGFEKEGEEEEKAASLRPRKKKRWHKRLMETISGRFSRTSRITNLQQKPGASGKVALCGFRVPVLCVAILSAMAFAIMGALAGSFFNNTFLHNNNPEASFCKGRIDDDYGKDYNFWNAFFTVIGLIFGGIYGAAKFHPVVAGYVRLVVGPVGAIVHKATQRWTRLRRKTPTIVMFSCITTSLLLGVLFFGVLDNVPRWHRGLRHAAGNFTEAAARSERAHNTSHTYMAEVDTDQLREMGALADDLDLVGQQVEELDAMIASFDAMAARMEAVPGMGSDASLLREKIDTLNQLKTTLEKVNKVTAHVQRHRHFFDDTIDKADELKDSGKADQLMMYMLDAAAWSQDLAALVDQLADNFVGCATLGLLVGLVVAIRSTWMVLRKYEQTVEEVQTQQRQKRDDWTPANFIITRAPTLLGVQFSSAIVGFFLLSALVAAVLLLLTYQPLIDFVIFGDANPLVIQLAVMKVVQLVVLDRMLTRGQLKGGRWSVTNDGGNVIQRPVMWSWLSSVLLLFGFVTGVLSAVTRFVFHILISVVALFRLDETIFPRKYIAYDAGYCAFMSVVMLRHRHTNPIWSAFLETYREVSSHNNKVAHAGAETNNAGGGGADTEAQVEEKKKTGTLAFPAEFDALSDADKTAMIEAGFRDGYAWRSRATTLKQRQARARWHLAYSLLNNPQLIPLRRQGGAGKNKRDYECWSSTSGSYKYWGPGHNEARDVDAVDDKQGTPKIKPTYPLKRRGNDEEGGAALQVPFKAGKKEDTKKVVAESRELRRSQTNHIRSKSSTPAGDTVPPHRKHNTSRNKHKKKKMRSKKQAHKRHFKTAAGAILTSSRRGNNRSGNVDMQDARKQYRHDKRRDRAKQHRQSQKKKESRKQAEHTQALERLSSIHRSAERMGSITRRRSGRRSSRVHGANI